MDFEERVLIVDDDPVARKRHAGILRAAGYDVSLAPNIDVAAHRIQQRDLAAVLLDLHLHEENGLTLLRQVKVEYPTLPVVLLTSESGVEWVVEAMRAGAAEYLTKPVPPAALIGTVRSFATRALPSRLVGRSDRMRSLLALAARVALQEVPVLISGEAGTGKELVARELHALSKRREQALVILNLSVFSARHQERQLSLRLASADGGTMVLHHVEDLCGAMQARLLQVLDRQSFFDVRLVATSHVDLSAEVRRGRFRPDLFYRLAAVELAMPALRDRPEDLLPLARGFLAAAAQSMGVKPLPLSTGAIETLRAHTWPGNGRELKNAMERAAICATGPRITPSDLPDSVRQPYPVAMRLREQEKALILEALHRVGGNVSEVSRRLSIPRSTLYRRLKKWGVR